MLYKVTLTIQSGNKTLLSNSNGSFNEWQKFGKCLYFLTSFFFTLPHFDVASCKQNVQYFPELSSNLSEMNNKICLLC